MSFDSVPAGEDVSLSSGMPVDMTVPEAVPLPKDADVIPADSNAAAADSVVADATEESPLVSRESTVMPQEGGSLSGLETIKFCTLLLKDGASFLNGLDTYTVRFHKEERIGGDLREPQVISMKVRHKPHFSVYMRWENGERGRQVLYSDEYNDGCMVVKFGGFKKLLPALKIDPLCASARAESRYPVTQAGILGMLNQILIHREADMKRGHGVVCRKIDDQLFDERRCYCFELEYDTADFSEIYRKSLILIDSRHHIPLKVRNYTWAKDAESLTPDQLDAATLIEDYSFTGFDQSRPLVAEDFSRDNPAYRM